MPRIAIVMPACDAAGSVGPALAALMAQKPSPPDLVRVVDDGSVDGTAAVAASWARRHPDRVQVIRRARGGEAAALNTGFAGLEADFLGIVESDVVVAPDWLDRMLRKLEATGAVGAGGALKPFPGDPWPARLAGYEVQARQASQGEGPVTHVTSANVLYRRRAREIAGAFREDLVNASLDSDFNTRLLAAGERLAWDPHAIAWHHYKPTLPGWLGRTLSYARTRWRVAQRELYPADRGLAARLLLDAAACSALLWGWVWPGWALVAAGAALAAHLPDALTMMSRHRDPACLLLPGVLVLRGGVGAVGLLLGLLEHPVAPPVRPEPVRG